MPTPHKHRDVIIAWANGEQIQWRSSPSDYWRDWEGGLTPDFGIPNNEYRIKPKTLVRYMAVQELHGKLYSSNLYETLDGCKAWAQRNSNTGYHRLVLEGNTIVSCERVEG